jgi:2-(1,2-epoxy-1,2-dihydrophenyl)acetyl-CoA isomerase
MSEKLIVKKDGEIASIIFNNPKAYNSFDLELITYIQENVDKLSKDDEIKGIIFSGEGKAFCTGGDLGWATSWPKGPSNAFHELATVYHQVILEIRRMPKPVIAAINGIAAGGGFSLALACDFRIMAKSAILKQGYTSNGLSLDGGGSFTLPRFVGLARALEIAAFDKPISADQALTWGLVTKVVEDQRVIEEALDMGRELSKISLNSFKASKNLLTDSFNTSLEAHLDNERDFLSSCADHPDGKEGISAFKEKRKPSFNRK